MKIQIIKDIILGPRQMTFGFDNNPHEDQNFVISCIIEQFENHGQVVLDKFVAYLKQMHDLPEIDTLQYIFWSAQELKIHFRVDGKNITPFETKQILLNSPDKYVEIITNKNVEDSIFQDVVLFYEKKLSKDKNQNTFDDQYHFSRSLLLDLEKWETNLNSFKPIAQKPFYPGREKIHTHLKSLKTILAKQDSYSMIYACYNNKEKIAKMAEDVKIISEFYTRQIKFWDLLITSIEKFRVNLNEIKKNPEIFSGFNRLTQILALPSPYNQISEADRLLKMVQNHNDLIVQEKTKAHCEMAISKIDSMIKKLAKLFDIYRPDQDLRNKILYELRSAEKKVSYAQTIQQINQFLYNTEDMFDDFVEELKEK